MKLAEGGEQTWQFGGDWFVGCRLYEGPRMPAEAIAHLCSHLGSRGRREHPADFLQGHGGHVQPGRCR